MGQVMLNEWLQTCWKEINLNHACCNDHSADSSIARILNAIRYGTGWIRNCVHPLRFSKQKQPSLKLPSMGDVSIPACCAYDQPGEALHQYAPNCRDVNTVRSGEGTLDTGMHHATWGSVPWRAVQQAQRTRLQHAVTPAVLLHPLLC